MNIDQARAILSPAIVTDSENPGDLDSLRTSISWFRWWAPSKTIEIDGEFTAEQLMAIAVWMRAHQ